MCTWFKADKNRCIKYSIVLGMLVLGMVLFVMDYRLSAEEIQEGLIRNSYGQGKRTEELKVHIENGEKEDLVVDISERMYEEAEVDEMFRECIERVEQEILAENKSLDYITENMNLMTTLEGIPVEIEWRLDHYDVMNVYGEIQDEHLEETGTSISLEAVITYTEDREKQEMYECDIKVYPKKLTGHELVIEKIKNQIQDNDETSRTTELLELPQVIDGKDIHYYRKMNERGLVLIFMAVLIGILFYAQEIQNQGQEVKKRQQQMKMDYPEIINKLTLFLGAGMTIKRAWKKIVTDYEASSKSWGKRYAYEEMKIACREMESGITEAESYERFGKRCNLQEYVRLGALLSQNMRKGTKGLSHILRLEAIQAFEYRKAAAKKYGEEAGTRLLVPMFIMFAVVLVMVIVPAFLSMQF